MPCSRIEWLTFVFRLRNVQEVVEQRQTIGEGWIERQQAFRDSSPCRRRILFRRDAEERTQHFQDRKQWSCLSEDMGTRLQDLHATRSAPFAEFEAEPAFTYSGLPDNADQARGTLVGVLQGLSQDRELGRPS